MEDPLRSNNLEKSLSDARFSVRSLWISFVVSISVLVFALWNSHHGSKAVVAALEERGLLRRESIALSQFLLALTEVETSQRGYLLTRSESYLAPYYRGLSRVHPSFEYMKSNFPSEPTLARMVTVVEPKLQRKLTELAQTIELAHAGQYGKALKLVNSDEGDRLMTEIRDVADLELESLKTRVTEITTSVAHLEERNSMLLGLSSFVAMAIAVLAFAAAQVENARRRRLEFRLRRANEELELNVRKRTEQLEMKSAMFETVLSQIPVAVIIAEADGKLIFSNDQIHKVWRHPMIESRSVEEYAAWKGFHPDGTPYAGQDWPLARSLQSGEIVMNEVTAVQRGDGSRGTFHLSSAPLRNSMGQITGGVVVCDDITEQIELAAAEKSAQQASKMKSEFLANMSHEIRTPINGVLGLTTLLMGTPLNTEQRGFAETILKSADHLLSVINDILDFSKIEAGRLDLETIAFSLRPVLKNTIQLLEPGAAAKDLRLEIEIADGVPDFIMGDPGRLGQILMNLIGNAIKFTDAGFVRTRLSVQELSGNRMNLRVEVRDSGIGIHKDTLAKLFRSFSQADSSTTRKFGGSGLGLSISRRLVELMHGSIGVESEIHHGSVFWFEIPIALPNALAPVAAISPPDIPLSSDRKYRILVAEDNPVNQLIAVRYLESFGFHPHAVQNGAEAVAALAADDYDLVLMDCQMPEVDGYMATRMIRSGGRVANHRVPIIAMTANALTGDQEKCLAAGMDDYLSKPIKPVLLKHAIDRHLRRAAG